MDTEIKPQDQLLIQFMNKITKNRRTHWRHIREKLITTIHNYIRKEATSIIESDVDPDVYRVFIPHEADGEVYGVTVVLCPKREKPLMYYLSRDGNVNLCCTLEEFNEQYPKESRR